MTYIPPVADPARAHDAAPEHLRQLILLAGGAKEAGFDVGGIRRLIVPEVFEGGDALWYARVAYGRGYVLTDGFRDRAAAQDGGFVLAQDIAFGRQRVLR